MFDNGIEFELRHFPFRDCEWDNRSFLRIVVMAWMLITYTRLPSMIGTLPAAS